jgi:hypothetical protein
LLSRSLRLYVCFCSTISIHPLWFQQIGHQDCSWCCCHSCVSAARESMPELQLYLSTLSHLTSASACMPHCRALQYAYKGVIACATARRKFCVCVPPLTAESGVGTRGCERWMRYDCCRCACALALSHSVMPAVDGFRHWLSVL